MTEIGVKLPALRQAFAVSKTSVPAVVSQVRSTSLSFILCVVFYSDSAGQQPQSKLLVCGWKKDRNATGSE